MQWETRFELGVEEIDRQHQELFARVGRLEASLREGDHQQVVEMLDFLGDYVVEHFGCEERKMKETGYPFFAIHKGVHDRFVELFLQIKAEYQQTGETAWLAIKVHKVMVAWLHTHILGMDQQFGRYLSAPAATHRPVVRA
ncbi:MAG: bacteriohemerythrin [Archangium sp.]|nr:bacteriohemerythrin [Archangium sp.]